MTIEKTTAKHRKTENGYWSKKPYETETETVNRTFYENYVNGCNPFSAYERKYYTYTYIGYVPYKVISVSPDRQEKLVTVFRFTLDNPAKIE